MGTVRTSRNSMKPDKNNSLNSVAAEVPVAPPKQPKRWSKKKSKKRHHKAEVVSSVTMVVTAVIIKRKRERNRACHMCNCIVIVQQMVTTVLVYFEWGICTNFCSIILIKG